MLRSCILAVAAGLVIAHEVPNLFNTGKQKKSPKTYKCVHDQLHAGNKERRLSVVNMQASQSARSLSVAPTWEPIRIQTVYKGIENEPLMDVTKTNFLKNVLMPNATSRWSQALSVKRLATPLYAARRCTSRWTDVIPNSCRSLDASTGCANFGDEVSIIFSADELGPDQYYPVNPSTVATMPAGPGYASTDLLIYVTAKHTDICQEGGILAYALGCQRLEDDRPSIGRINFCPQELSADPVNYHAQLYTALHEIGHILGFGSDHFPLFRKSDGTPRTPRDPAMPFRVDSAYYKSIHGCGDVEFASNSTINYFQERGATLTYPDNLYPPYQGSAKLVTETVAEVSKWFFDCDTIEGAELENQDTTSCFLQGSHWEARLLRYEFMAAYLQQDNKMSPLTLALMQDSGWYKADFSAADSFSKERDYGFKQGCSFAKDSCAVSSANPPHFYTSNRLVETGSGICSVDRKGMAKAEIYPYNSALPSRFQYFGVPTSGGLQETDYCVVAETYGGGTCRDMQATNFASWGFTTGETSYCHLTNMRWTGSGPGAGCFLTYCVNDAVVITVATPTLVNITCQMADEGSAKPAGSFLGGITCPSVTAFCGYVYKYGEVQPTPDPTRSPTLSPSVTRSNTGTSSNSRSASASASVTRTQTQTRSQTPSFTATPSFTPNAEKYVSIDFSIGIPESMVSNEDLADVIISFIAELCNLLKTGFTALAQELDNPRQECSVGIYSACDDAVYSSFAEAAAVCEKLTIRSTNVLHVRQLGLPSVNEALLRSNITKITASTTSFISFLQESGFSEALGASSENAEEFLRASRLSILYDGELLHPEEPAKSSLPLIAIIAGSIGGLLVLVVIFVLCCCCCRKSGNKSKTNVPVNAELDVVVTGDVVRTSQDGMYENTKFNTESMGRRSGHASRRQSVSRSRRPSQAASQRGSRRGSVASHRSAASAEGAPEDPPVDVAPSAPEEESGTSV